MNNNKEEVLKFLKFQRVMVIASKGEDVWVSNVYFGIDDNSKIYFVSPKGSKHSRQILNNNKVAFSVHWHNKENHKDRKAIQGKGICRITNCDEEIIEGIRLHNTNFPEFKERITVEWAKNPQNPDVWVIEPSYMKFWNDELYGENGTEDFIFKK